MKNQKKNKVLVLTGGSSGIGLATVKLFAENNYIVYELSRSGKSFDNIKHITCDVTNEENVKSAIKQVIDEQGRMDLLINNAGFGISGPIEFTSIEDAKKQFDVNFFGAFNVVKAATPFMREAKQGRIVFVSSVAAIFSIPFQAFYSAAKSAMNSLTLALANELRPFNVSVCGLLPGDVSTSFTANREKNDKGKETYTKMDKSIKTMEHDETHGMSSDKMAKKLLKIAKKRHVKPFYVGGAKYAFFCFLAKVFPTRFFNWVVGKLY